MEPRILTEVSARVDTGDVAGEFARLLDAPLPDGLLRTELLSGADGEWRIQSLWRDRAALDAMRASGEPPAAPALFARLGATPELRVYTVAAASETTG